MKTDTFRLFGTMTLLVILSASLAQADDGFSLTWYTIDGGGMTFHEGGGFRLGGTTGQPDAGVVHSGGGFTLTGGFWALQSCAAPSISSHPDSQTVCEGDPVTFCVTAGGTLPLSYQWRKDDENIAGATESCYTIDPVVPSDEGMYDVVVTNACGSVGCNPATLVVDPLPAITEQPAPQTACVGGPATFTVVASGAISATAIDTIGSTANSSAGPRLRGNSYAVTTTTKLTEIEHFLHITDSGSIKFYVYEADTSAGPYTLIFETTVPESGTGQQWYSSGPLDITLQEGQFYIIGAGWPDSHSYYWGGSHPQATAFGESEHGFATSYQDPLPKHPTPSSSLLQHQRLTTYQSPYQWRKNGENLEDGPNISGTTTDTLEIDPVALDDAGEYDVVVANECGSVTSDPATLTVNVPGFGDWDEDCDVDLVDFEQFVACMTGPDGGPIGEGCDVFDFDVADDDIDMADFAAFQEAFTGPAGP
ncbi:MAG: immunoglobulin domain-containing protein [Phycisphaerae bacterium]|nr:immunoglobulin domain-containing protein [Phycisphaerae bacterium]